VRKESWSLACLHCFRRTIVISSNDSHHTSPNFLKQSAAASENHQIRPSLQQYNTATMEERASLFRNSPALTTISTRSVPQNNNNNHCEISGPPTAVVLDDDDVHSCITEFSILPPEVMKAKLVSESSFSSPLSVQDIAHVFQPKQSASSLLLLATVGQLSPCQSESEGESISTSSKASPVPESSTILRGKKLFDRPKSTSTNVQRGVTTIIQPVLGSAARSPIRRERTSCIGSFLTPTPKLQRLEAGSSNDQGSKTTTRTSRNLAGVSAESAPAIIRGRKTRPTSNIVSKPETVQQQQQIIPSNVNGGKPPTRSSTASTSTGKSWNVSETAAAAGRICIGSFLTPPPKLQRVEAGSSDDQGSKTTRTRNLSGVSAESPAIRGRNTRSTSNIVGKPETIQQQQQQQQQQQIIIPSNVNGGKPPARSSTTTSTGKSMNVSKTAAAAGSSHAGNGNSPPKVEPSKTETQSDASAVEPLKPEQESKRSLFSATTAAAEASSVLVVVPPRVDTTGTRPDTKSSSLATKAKPPRSDSMAYLFANRPVSQGVENWKGKLSRQVNEPRESVGSAKKSLPVAAGSAKFSKGEETDETKSEQPNNKENVVKSKSPERSISRQLSSGVSHFSPGAEKGKQKLRSRRMRISGDENRSPRLSSTNWMMSSNRSEVSTISQVSVLPKEDENVTVNISSHESSSNDTLQKMLAKALEKIAEMSKAQDADRARWQVSSVELVRVKKEHEAGLLEGHRQRMKIEDYETVFMQKDFQLGSLGARRVANKPENKTPSPGNLLSAGEMMEELQSTVAKMTVENHRLLKERDTYQTQSRLQKEEIETMDDLESFLRREVEEYKNMLDAAEKGREIAEKRVIETTGKREELSAKPNEFQKREIDRLTMENRQLLEERESLETPSRLMHKEEVDAFEKHQMETDSKVTLLHKEAAYYKALFQTSQDDRGVSKSRISELEKELQNISKLAADEEQLRNQEEDHLLTTENRRLLDERESLLTQGRLHEEETESLEKCLKEMESNESSLRKELDEYKVLLETAQHEHKVSRKRLDSMEEELQRSTDEQVAGSKEAVEELKEINEIQTQKNNRLAMENRQLLKEHESMQIQLRERIEEIETQENSLNELESTKEALKQQEGNVEALSKELSQIRQDSQANETSLRVELESSKAEHTVLKDTALEETKGVELLKHKLEEAQTSIEEAHKTMAQLAEECELLRAKEQEQLEKITSLENQSKENATSSGTTDGVDLSELLIGERARCELAEKKVETYKDRIEQLEHSLKAQQGWASTYEKSIEFLEDRILQLGDTKIGGVLKERSAAEPSFSVDEELQTMSGKQTLEDYDHETQQEHNAKESNSSTGGPRAADGIHLNQADYIKSIVARQKSAGAPNNKRGWAHHPRLSNVFSRVPGVNGDSTHDSAAVMDTTTLEAQNVKLQSDLVKMQALHKDESYNNRKKLKELEEENLDILKKYSALAEVSRRLAGRGSS
jgi:hypothetical protein